MIEKLSVINVRGKFDQNWNKTPTLTIIDAMLNVNFHIVKCKVWSHRDNLTKDVVSKRLKYRFSR